MAIKPKGGNWLGGDASELNRYLDDLKWVPEARAPEPGGTAARAKAVETWLDKQLKRYVMTDMGTKGDPLLDVEREGRLHVTPEQFENSDIGTPATTRGERVPGRDSATGRATTLRNPWANEDAFHRAATGRTTRTPWEQLSEGAIARMTARAHVNEVKEFGDRGPLSSPEGVEIPKQYEWLSKLADKEDAALGVTHDPWKEGVTPVYDFPRGLSAQGDPLHLSHVADYLRQSNLTPEQISRVSVADAVRGTHDWSQRLLKQKQESSLSKGVKATLKEYPEGMKWVELGPSEQGKVTSLDALPEGYQVKTFPNSSHAQVIDPNGVGVSDTFIATDPEGVRRTLKQVNDHVAYGPAEEGLKAEGEAMGHCVGGYCDPVMQGRTRILSLRDANNQPHATVELNQPDGWMDYRGLDKSKLVDVSKLSNEEMATLDVQMRAAGMPRSASMAGEAAKRGWFYHPDAPSKWINPQDLEDPQWMINQIKGKGNGALADRYKPYGQDLVRNLGPWHESVGDLRNTGLRNVDNDVMGVISDQGYATQMFFQNKTAKNIREAALKDLGRHATKEELEAWVKSHKDLP